MPLVVMSEIGRSRALHPAFLGIKTAYAELIVPSVCCHEAITILLFSFVHYEVDYHDSPDFQNLDTVIYTI